MSVGLATEINQQNQESDIRKSIEAKEPYLIITIRDTNKPIGYVRLNGMGNTNYSIIGSGTIACIVYFLLSTFSQKNKEQ